MRIDRSLGRWLRRARLIRKIAPRPGAVRERVDHVVILDGTNSTLVQGNETNAGIAYKLLRETTPSPTLNLHYEAGVPWDSWRATASIITGYGINGRIRRAYGAIASRYQPGDRIYLIGFSRGGYAVRSLAGIIGLVGLLKSEHATERNIRQVFRHYEVSPSGETASAFAEAFCQKDVEIELVASWDTVKSLGLRVPVLWRLTESKYHFHNHELGAHVKVGLHAIALDETRDAFAPVLWDTPSGYHGRIEQVWFRGSHGDIGGQLGGFNEARFLSNIPLIWLLEGVESTGIRLPADWQRRFDCDVTAEPLGNNRGWAKFFLARHRRVVGNDASEFIHPSVVALAQNGGAPAPDLPVWQPSENV